MKEMDELSLISYAPRRPVDHRLSLKVYFRTADTILKQANIYRSESNILELYILLLRYASLVSETIPQHCQYNGIHSLDKAHLKRKLLEALEELETLKPNVQKKIRINNQLRKNNRIVAPARTQSFSEEKQHERGLSLQANSNVYKSTLHSNLEHNTFLRLPTPSAETLARHSFLGATPRNSRPLEPLKVQYPSLCDPSPFEIESATPPLEPVLVVDEEATCQKEEPPSQFDLVNQLAPPPVLAPVEQLPHSEPDVIQEIYTPSKDPKHVYLSTKVMDEFLRIAHANTLKNIETCGILAGTLKNGRFSLTTLIIPKQEATANTCEAKDEKQIYYAQSKRGLFPLGWIHTHPTQSCFLSSVDVHTHYGYQMQMIEAIAIVMSPEDPSRKFGIFRLSDPGGMNVLHKCGQQGFHSHENPSDGSPLYEKCSHVYFDPTVGVDVLDLRPSM